MNLLVIGESCLDVFVYGTVERLAPEAPVPVFNKESSINNPGMASNVQRNLLALGCKTVLYTNDNWESIKKTRFVESKSNHMFIRVDESDFDYGRCDISKIDFKAFDCVVISDYNKGWLSNSDIQHIGENSKITILDTKKILGPWANSIDLIKINETEFERTKSVLTNEIFDKLIITLGPRGAMHCGLTFASPEVARVDSCGAGDTFVAALAKKYTESKDVNQSIEFANIAASVVVQKRGVSVL